MKSEYAEPVQSGEALVVGDEGLAAADERGCQEKSLGTIAKGGTRPIVEVVDYSELPSRRGLVVMNTPSAACESMTELAAGGAQIIIFSTGRGNAIGAPVVPPVKVTGNPNTARTWGRTSMWT